jgi:hypothetical protein
MVIDIQSDHLRLKMSVSNLKFQQVSALSGKIIAFRIYPGGKYEEENKTSKYFFHNLFKFKIIIDTIV